MRKQVTPLAATLSFRAAKDLIKGILHIGRFYNLFYYVTFSTHFISNYGHTAFNLPGLTSSSLTAYQTLPDACFSVFQPFRAAVTGACFPRLHGGDKSPVLYADLNFLRLLFRREPIFEFEFEASLFAFAYDTPPFAFALLYPRKTTRLKGNATI